MLSLRTRKAPGGSGRLVVRPYWGTEVAVGVVGGFGHPLLTVALFFIRMHTASVWRVDVVMLGAVVDDTVHGRGRAVRRLKAGSRGEASKDRRWRRTRRAKIEDVGRPALSRVFSLLYK